MKVVTEKRGEGKENIQFCVRERRAHSEMLLRATHRDREHERERETERQKAVNIDFKRGERKIYLYRNPIKRLGPIK